MRHIRLGPLFVIYMVLVLWSYPSAAEPDNKSAATANITWINISGTVGAVFANRFALDYGSGKITVEMNGADRDADGYKLLRGDKVVVNAMIDDDFYKTTTIEANSLYVDKLNTYFYSSAVDGEDYGYFNQNYCNPIITGETSIEGYVSDVNKNQFTINSGARSVIVNVETLPYNPLDNSGYLQVSRGDVVRAYGIIQDTLFQNRILTADTIVILVSA